MRYFYYDFIYKCDLKANKKYFNSKISVFNILGIKLKDFPI